MCLIKNLKGINTCHCVTNSINHLWVELSITIFSHSCWLAKSCLKLKLIGIMNYVLVPCKHCWPFTFTITVLCRVTKAAWKVKKKEKRLDKISKDCHEDQHTKQSHSVIEHRTLFDENYQHSLQRDLTMWLVSCTGPRHLHSRQNCGKTHLMWAVGEVHASDVHSGFDHLFQHLHRPGGWPCRQSLKVKD